MLVTAVAPAGPPGPAADAADEGHHRRTRVPGLRRTAATFGPTNHNAAVLAVPRRPGPEHPVGRAGVPGAGHRVAQRPAASPTDHGAPAEAPGFFRQADRRRYRLRGR